MFHFTTLHQLPYIHYIKKINLILMIWAQAIHTKLMSSYLHRLWTSVMEFLAWHSSFKHTVGSAIFPDKTQSSGKLVWRSSRTTKYNTIKHITVITFIYSNRIRVVTTHKASKYCFSNFRYYWTTPNNHSLHRHHPLNV